MGLARVRDLYAYHRWANRALFDATAHLGEDAAAREIGSQFSFPTLKGMFAHIYGADWIWLERWKGNAPERLPRDADFPSLAALRARWDPLEKEQQAFVEGLDAAALARQVRYRDTRGNWYTLPLEPLLEHVANHATHHRSEIATMLTMVSGPPPATDRVYYELIKSGQMKPH
jgi:uncharacterized damage-inducible protein DinB